MEGNISKKRRLQAGAACDNCRKRKSRCDGGRPRCSNCQIRSIVCDYDDHHADVNPTGTEQTISTSNDSERSSDFRRTSSSTNTHESAPSRDYYGDTSTFNFGADPSQREIDELSACQRESPVSYMAHNPTSGFRNGNPTGAIASFFDLPDRGFADILVDAYFNRMHRLYPFVHEGVFRAEYESMWDRSATSRSQMRLPWFGVLNMIFAHGYECSRDVQSQNAQTVGASFVARSKSIVLFQAFKPGTLETVQASLLMCYYLQGTLGLDECWNIVGLMIRSAISLGLHIKQDEKYLPVDREVRKRVWWGCFVADRTLSMKFGRPPTLRIEEANVDLPLEVDDQYISNESRTPRQPTGVPSFLAFFTATIQLTQIIFEMLTGLYLRGIERPEQGRDTKLSLSSPHHNRMISKVILVDGQLQNWWHSVPTHLVGSPEREGSHGGFLSMQKIVLKIRYLHVRLLLHRQVFLDLYRDHIEDEYCQAIAAVSARICIDSARQTIQLITTSHARQSLTSISFNAQYLFTSMCILNLLNNMGSDKVARLGPSMDIGEAKDYYNMGMELLQASSRSRPIAARYITILQHFQTQQVKERLLHTRHISNLTADPLPGKQPPDSQMRVTIDPSSSMPDPFSDSTFDFVDIDNLVFDEDLLNFGITNLENSLPALTTNW